MTSQQPYDVIIIGGSYAGLSAAMALGRSLRKVLIIDSGKPCNRQTPHSHNFITHDGAIPAAIAMKAKEQVLQYQTVQFYPGLATSVNATGPGFEIGTRSGDNFFARKLLFATGIKDTMPAIDGFAECWGISVIHCPYCHGYEVRGEKTGLFSNGAAAFEMARLISNLTDDLTLFTNGPSTLEPEQSDLLSGRNIPIVELEISRIEHTNGRMQHLIFKDGSNLPITAMYAKVDFTQHSELPLVLGCETDENGFLQVDGMQMTNVNGVYASGDCAGSMRSVAAAVFCGNKAGAVLNKVLVGEDF
ncbi:MAG: NAD(P)/FAD-dependent oxidoreductase [Saprospiraceae bacterium]|nr:NAD(P)/FAD-dependent oxidoreductase [Lewinella sp.]